MQDNIEQANAAFYNKAERGELYLFLLHDFQKAYDSLSRRYLFSLLARIGTPQWVIHAISALFLDVQARPVLAGGHDTVIHMANGLKQGCPLSPLLFNLALDPLLSVLSRRARTDCWGYADDVALGFQELADLPAALLPLDRFKAASGLSSSTTKTLLVCTQALDRKALHDALPAHWRFIKPVAAATYLGIPIGKEVTKEDVFAGTVAKLRSRVDQYLPLKGLYTVQNRVLIANSFLTPLFSHLFRFFRMPRALHQDVRSTLLAWVAPRLLGYDHLLASTAQGGLSQPLRCTTQANIAFLLHKRTFPAQIPHTRRAPTSSISSHILTAAADFQRIVGTHPPPDGTFKEVLALLGRHDKTAWNALVKQLNPNRVGRDFAEATATRIHHNLGSLPAHLPAQLRYHACLLAHNALPTRGRTCSFARGGQAEWRSVVQPGLRALWRRH